MGGDLRAAISLLTRLPIHCDRPPLPRDVWAYPIVGWIVGGFGAIVLAGLLRAGLPPLLASLWALAAATAMTGALHGDGLADTADGFGGGRDVARKLAIMRDSRIGSFGALALILSVAIRAAALAASHDPARAFLIAATLGRAGIIVPLVLLAPARTDGMAASLAHPPPSAAVIGGLIAAATSVALLGVLRGGAAVCIATIAAALVARLARQQIGGHTGDVLGATEQLVECAVLSLLAA